MVVPAANGPLALVPERGAWEPAALFRQHGWSRRGAERKGNTTDDAGLEHATTQGFDVPHWFEPQCLNSAPG